MDINKMSIDEIEKIQAELEQRKKTLKDAELKARKLAVQQKLNTLLQNKEIILSLLEHSRTSCSDDNPSNGYSHSDGCARCSKCHLIDIFDYGYEDGEFDVSFSVTITKIQ